MDWERSEQVLHRYDLRVRFGRRGYEPVMVLRCLPLGQWHDLSDAKLNDSHQVRLEFMRFSGVDLHSDIPDETTHCRFWGALVEAGAYDVLLAEVCARIKGHGVKVKNAEAATIGATFIQSAVRWVTRALPVVPTNFT